MDRRAAITYNETYMTKTTLQRCLLVLMAGLLAPVLAAQEPTGLSSDELPSAEQVLDRYIEVTGGEEAYQSRTSEITHGIVNFAAAGIRGTMTRYSEGSNYRYIMDIPVLGTIEMGVVEDIAWENSLLLGPRIKEGTERAEAMREADLDSELDWRDLYADVSVTGMEEIDGEPCYVVVAAPHDGYPITTWYSIESGFAIRSTSTTVSQMGEVPFEVRMFDYQDFGGVMIPARTQEIAAGQNIEITIESVEANVEIPAERFALPADVAALVETVE